VNKHKLPDSIKIGILLTNLGTPDAPTKAAVRPFLKALLSDSRVVGTPPPRWLWMLILNGIILNIRPQKSAKKYQSVWDTHGEGSPLLAISKKQKNAVETALNEHSPGEFSVALGMRYGNPSIASALKILESENCEKILVLPLYPQYASSSTGSAFDAVNDEIKKLVDIEKRLEACRVATMGRLSELGLIKWKIGPNTSSEYTIVGEA